MAAKRFRTACGLDDVYLANGFALRDSRHGKSFSIDNVDGLHAAIGRFLVHERKVLGGNEIRFLRHELNLSQGRLAALLGVDEQTVARWEKGQAGISGPADRIIRLLYVERIGGQAKVARLIEHLAELDDAGPRAAVFEQSGAGWRLA